MISLLVAASPQVSIVAEKLFSIGGVPVTNSMLLGFFAYSLLILLAVLLARAVTRGSKNRLVVGAQWIFEGLLTSTEEVIGSPKLARRVAPLAITIFFVVIFNNWFGILPGVGSIQYGSEPLFRGLGADLNFTFALAIITMVTVQIYAVKEHGFFGNIGRYILNPLKNPIGAFEGILELVGEFSRFVALSMRLFGNVFGGEVLLTVIAFLSGWFGFLPLPLFMGFELFIGGLQAYVFYMLTIIFISLAVEHHDSEHATEKKPKEPALTGNSKTVKTIN